MIPLRDSVRPRTTPFVNWILIALNLYVFIREVMLPPRQLNEVFYTLGVIPASVTQLLLNGSDMVYVIITFFTAMFLHGGWTHMLGNMLFLWVFGDNVEDRLGHFKYFLFYLATGIFGSIAHIISNPFSEVPIIGASGAIAGVLGAYFVTFPRARVLTLLPIIIFFTIVEIPAVIFLAFWFVLQLFNGTASLGGAVNPVAWWAHVGGFLSGIALIKIMAPGRKHIYNRE
ncbi:MAG: protease [Peptococcaceae bacterium BICA1-7]|nr:MAG: protease [Peptococcaceae bacterium BICA1-7]HBV96426.1 rhomboid family intramembrane serine protease [Desulfotomaculum sp.]